MSSLFEKAMTVLDAANAQDPRKITWEGREYPYEQLYSKWLEDWIRKMDEVPSETLLLASRGQHLCRWMIPRTDYETGRKGYLQWRQKLYRFHAEKTGEILEEVGYPKDEIEKVQAVILKKNPKQNREVQIMEDALCLVFLDFQFNEFKTKTAAEKMPEIVRKTWAKMSTKAQNLALQLPFSQEEKNWIISVLTPHSNS